MTSARTRELFGLIPVALLVTAGFTAVLIARSDEIQTVTATYGGVFLGCCLLGHLFIRWRLPHADPYLFPLAALLAAFGLVMLYRIDPEKALGQGVVFGLGLLLFCATIVSMRDHRSLERYRYTIAAAGIVLLALPRLPGIGGQVNGAYLEIDLGFLSFQPAEFAKLAIIVFLASYLTDTRGVIIGGRLAPPPLRRSLPLVVGCAVLAALLVYVLDYPVWPSVLASLFIAVLVALLRERPSLKHLGPLILIWGFAMLMLVFIQDLGSALMFFGAFLAILYVATARLSFVAFGLVLFLAGATFFATNVGHVQDRIAIWQDPFAKKVVNDEGYQVAQSLFAQADGGLFGRGFGEAVLTPPGGGPAILPAADTDVIYALIVNELGLFGAGAVIIVALLFVARGFKTALSAHDDFSKLLAAGLSAVFALQVFVIVGGVIKLIPLTGVTLPFVSYGGSSIIANFILLALLLIVSNHARGDAERSAGGGLV